jgi:hypothetical protein
MAQGARNIASSLAAEGVHHVGAAYRCARQADAQDAGHRAPLLDRNLVGQHRHHRSQHRVEEQLRQAPTDQHHPDLRGKGDDQDAEGPTGQTDDHPRVPHPPP